MIFDEIGLLINIRELKRDVSLHQAFKPEPINWRNRAPFFSSRTQNLSEHSILRGIAIVEITLSKNNHYIQVMTSEHN